MTPEITMALDVAVKHAGSQAALCRAINKPQSTYCTWINGSGPTPASVGELVRITKGECTPVHFRPDVFGFLKPITAYLSDKMPDDARLAGIDLAWHQIDAQGAVAHLMAKGWSRKRARAAVDFLTDNDYLGGEAAA